MRALIGTPLIGKPKPWYFPTGGGLGGGPIGGLSLLKGEAQGLGVDFSVAAGPNAGFGSVAVKDTTTPGNNKNNVTASEFFTQSGTSPKLVLWSDGLYRWSPHNLALASEDATSGSWATKTNITTPAIDSIKETTGNGVHILSQGSVPMLAGEVYTVRIEIKKDGRQYAGIKLASGFAVDPILDVDFDAGTLNGAQGTTNNRSITALGDGYFRISFSTAVATGTSTSLQILCKDDTNTSFYVGDVTKGVKVRKAQFNRATTPTAYHVTTSAAWFGVPIEYDPTTAKFYVLVEPAATNLVLQASAPATSPWYVVGGTTVTNNAAVGPDGTTTAARVQIGAGVQGNVTVEQIIALAASQTHTAAVFYKSNTGGNQKFALKVTQQSVADHYSPDITATQVWQRASFSQAFGAGGTGSGIVGIASDAAGEAADILVWLYQGEANSPVATSPIPTFAATVTRSADNLNVATSAFPSVAAVGSFIAVVNTSLPTAGPRLTQLTDGTNNERNLTGLNSSLQSTQAVVHGGSVQATQHSTNTMTASVTFKVASAWQAGDMAQVLNGGTPATGAPAAMATGITTLYLGRDFDAAPLAPLRFSTFVALPRRPTNAELQAKTL